MARRIGLIGGMSPESTVVYYERIVHESIRRFGNHQYPEILVYSVTFQPYIEMMQAGDWDAIAEGLTVAAKSLEAAGAEVLGIATNTMHIVLDKIQEAVDLPFVSILDAVGDEIKQLGFARVGLLGTRFTMELNPYAEALEKREIDTIVPNEDDRAKVNQIIFDELIEGEIKEESKHIYLEVISRLRQRGAQAIVLGCTEIPLLVKPEDTQLPLLDSTFLHADALLEEALK